MSVMNLLFAPCVEIYPANVAVDLVETNIIESLEARAGYFSNAMVRNEKNFFPSHEDILTLRAILIVKVGLFGLLSQRAPGRESPPVLHIRLVSSSPCFMASLKSILRSNDLTFKIGCQRWVVIGKAC